MLQGSEVKSLREAKVQLPTLRPHRRRRDLPGRPAHRALLEPSVQGGHELDAPRKLLLHRHEIDKLQGPGRPGAPHPRAAVALLQGRPGQARARARPGAASYDKRQVIAKRDADMDARRAMGGEVEVRVAGRWAPRSRGSTRGISASGRQDPADPGRGPARRRLRGRPPGHPPRPAGGRRHHRERRRRPQRHPARDPRPRQWRGRPRAGSLRPLRGPNDFGSQFPLPDHHHRSRRHRPHRHHRPGIDDPREARLPDVAVFDADGSRLFDDLKRDLVPLIAAIADHGTPVNDDCLHGHFPVDKQREFVLSIVSEWGYNPDSWRLDPTVHPFASNSATTDIPLRPAFTKTISARRCLGTMHECGHGLYENGVSPSLERTPLCRGASLGLHESQSRMWENLVGRSPPFWRRTFPRLQAAFPEQLAGIRCRGLVPRRQQGPAIAHPRGGNRGHL